jgi:lipopolysaccharide cholinephosphotransferase
VGGTKELTGKHADKALKMLVDITNILEKCDISYILDGGTLLGVIRENRLLPWDTDVDLAITRDHEKALLSVRWRMWLAGYRTRIRKFKKDTGPFKKGMVRLIRIQTRKFLVFKEYSLMDIFIKTRIEDEYQWVVNDKRPMLKFCPRCYYENLRKYPFAGKEYSIPSDYQGYLQYHYGNWKIEKKDWNSRIDDSVKKIDLSLS